MRKGKRGREEIEAERKQGGGMMKERNFGRTQCEDIALEGNKRMLREGGRRIKTYTGFSENIEYSRKHIENMGTEKGEK